MSVQKISSSQAKATSTLNIFSPIILHIALASVVLITAAVIMWNHPILADEWDFYRAMTQWQQQRARIPHPHAYVHLSQLFLAIFGQTPNNARIPGILSALLNLILIPMLVYEILGKNRQSQNIAIVAIWIYTLNPTTAQNMMLLDIDNTILTPVLCFMLWLWKVTENCKSIQRITLLGLMFGLSLWVKIPTPILLVGAIGLYHLIRGQFQRLLEIALATILGTGFFMVTFSLYSQLTGFQFSFLNRTFRKAPTSTNAIPAILVRFPQGLGVFILWLSFPLMLLALFIMFESVRRLIKRRLNDKDLLVIYILGTTLVYALILPPAWGYPKYQSPLFPLIAILIANLSVPAFQTLPRRALYILLGLGGLIFLYKLLIVGDPFYSLYAITFETSIGDLNTRLNQGIRTALKLLLPLGIVLGVSYWLAKHWQHSLTAVVISALSILAFADMTSTTLVQVNANYSTRYRYTYNYDNLRQTLKDLEQADVEYMLGLLEVLYYEGRTGEQIYYKYMCDTCAPQTLIDKIQSERVDALVWTTKEANRAPQVSQDPDLNKVLTTCYIQKKHGVFFVYIRKPDAPCPKYAD